MFVVEQVTFPHLYSSMFQLRPGIGMCGLGAASPSRSALAKQGLLEHAGPRGPRAGYEIQPRQSSDELSYRGHGQSRLSIT